LSKSSTGFEAVAFKSPSMSNKSDLDGSALRCSVDNGMPLASLGILYALTCSPSESDPSSSDSSELDDELDDEELEMLQRAGLFCGKE